MTVSPAVWTDLCALDEVPVGGLKPVASGEHKLVVSRPDDGAPAVLDNRCPHEGYPLSQGSLSGGTLTCCWHNWKFRVADGACVMGGEAVRAWPTRVEQGRVQADLAGPDPETLIPPLRESLAQGLLRHDNGRVVRDGLRLVELGFEPRRLLLEAAALDGRHAEYGASHVLPLAADCARALERLPGPRALEAVAPVFDLCGETNLRRPPRPRAAAAPYTSLDDLRAAIEAEDGPRAQALVGGLLATGPSLQQVEMLFLRLNADHFTSFGHPLIYASKLGLLLTDRDEPEQVADLCHGLVDGLIYATREDTLPYWGRYQRRLEGWAERLPGWAAKQAAVDPAAAHGATNARPHHSDKPQQEGGTNDHAHAWDGAPLRDAVLDGSAEQALDQLEAALEAGAPLTLVARWLLAAAAHRLLRFDVALDGDPSVAENWLWASHRFTFAAAVRHAVERVPAEDGVRLAHQTLAFTHSGRPMDVDADPSATRPAARGVDAGVHAEAGAPEGVDAVLAAIGAKHAARAVAAARACLSRPDQATRLEHALQDLALSDPVVRPIVVAHVIKTTWAAFEARAALAGLPDADVPVLAAVRMLASPIRERRVHELVGSSIAWVVHGKLPTKLTQ